jgi:hypothetical protein
MPHTSPEASLVKGTGGFGSILITDTQTHTGEFFSIQVLEDCLFSTLSSTDMENVTDFVSKNIIAPAGLVISANFTAIKLASGKIIAYKH